MRVASLFVTDPARFALLDGRASPAECRAAVEALPAGAWVALAARLDQPGRLARLAALAGLRWRVRALGRKLARAGAAPAGRFGLFPSVEAPTVVYEIGSPAAAYAERRLLARPGAGLGGVLHRVVGRASGCSASLAGVLVVGRKP
jgi:hypothetical protein